MFRLISFEKKFNDINNDMHYTVVINGETPKILVDSWGAGIVEMKDGTRLFVSTSDSNVDCVYPIHATETELDELSENKDCRLDVLWSLV